MSGIVQVFPTLRDFVAWLDERANEKQAEAEAEPTRRRLREKAAYASGLRTAARALQEARIEELDESFDRQLQKAADELGIDLDA